MILNMFGIKILIENMATELECTRYRKDFYRNWTSGTRFNC